MYRIILFLVLIALAAAGAAWIADQTGDVMLSWGGWRVQTSLPVFALAFGVTIVAGMLAWTILRTLWRMDLTRNRRLKQLATPTLVLWGRDDKVNRPAGGPMLANLMPNADLVMTSRTGHWMQWERADLFNKVAVDFLSEPSVFTQ